MRETDRPGSEAQFFFAGTAAKIHVVEVEVKKRIEADRVARQSRLPGSEEHAIQQLAIGGNRTEGANGAKRIGSMGDGTAEVGLLVPGPTCVQESPGGLVADSATVAGDADHIVGLEPFDDPLCKEVVVDPDVVVNEYQDVMRVRGADTRVEHLGE